MRCAKLLLPSLFVFVFVLPVQVAAQPGSELTYLSSSINDRLTDLKRNSAIVTEQLTALCENLELSQQEALQWKAQSTILSDSLASINEELNSSYETIIKYEQKLKTTNKVLSALCCVLIGMLLFKIFAYVIYAKGVKLPRWLDILL